MNGKRTYCGIDWNHLKAIRLWFTNDNAKAKVSYQSKEVASFGGIIYSSCDASMEFLKKDYHPRIEDNRVNIALVGYYGIYSVTSFKFSRFYVTLDMLDRPAEYNGQGNDWDGYLRTYGNPGDMYRLTRHPFMFLTIEGNYASFRTIGTTREYSTYLGGVNWSWYIYKDIEITNAAGALYADFIYQGDVDI